MSYVLYFGILSNALAVVLKPYCLFSFRQEMKYSASVVLHSADNSLYNALFILNPCISLFLRNELFGCTVHNTFVL